MEPDLAIDELDAVATLAAVEGGLVARRAAEARDLALAAHWADLHAVDPQRLRPSGRREWRGEDRLVDHRGTHVLTEPVGSDLLSDNPVDRALAQMQLDLQATGRATVPHTLS